jgi:NitT/TauT family transport system permease protein
MSKNKLFFPRQVVEDGGSRWDWALRPIVLALLILLGYRGAQMAHPYHLGEPLPLSLEPANLSMVRPTFLLKE